MRSMTGYGRGTVSLGDHSVAIQISSVNRRALDLTVKVPPDWESLEGAIGEAVRKVASRGKIHVDLEVTTAGGGEDGWDDAAIQGSLERLAALCSRNGLPFAPTAELLWQIAGARRKSGGLPAADTARDTVLAGLAACLRDFAAMRSKEGAALLADFLARLALLHSLIEGIALRAPRVAPAYREALHKRLRDAGLELDVSDDRVLKEIALFADRADITEELTRFRSHLDQLEQLLRSDGEIGRKAEFILQELGREVHTIGSKANDLEISRTVIELKNELERVKEQIANVE
jgi:uncharacterized protein YicC (UPF0701 family)